MRIAMVVAILLVSTACGPSELERLQGELAGYKALASRAEADVPRQQAMMNELDTLYSYILSQDHFYHSDLRDVPTAMVKYDKDKCLDEALAQQQILSCISKIRGAMGSELFAYIRIAIDADSKVVDTTSRILKLQTK